MSAETRAILGAHKHTVNRENKTSRGTSGDHAKLVLVWFHCVDRAHQRTIVTVDAGIESCQKTESVHLEHTFRPRVYVRLLHRVRVGDILDGHDSSMPGGLGKVVMFLGFGHLVVVRLQLDSFSSDSMVAKYRT